jgi:large subunit ribosomal protein L16
MLMPKKVKFRKHQRGNNKGLATRGSEISFGEYALKSTTRGLITSRQIESARKAISNKTKRGGKIWVRIFPDKPIHKKPAETRMGSGKSPVDHFAVVIRPGRILFEIGGVDEATAREAFERADAKLPLKTKFVKDEL